MPPLYDLTIDATGSFSQAVDLPAGQWQITITASAASVTPVQETRTVTVKPPVATAMTVVITAAHGPSWLRVISDGVVMKASGWGGPILDRGKSLTVNGLNEIYLRTGNASALEVTVNGQPVNLTGSVGDWLFHPGQPPEQTNERR